MLDTELDDEQREFAETVKNSAGSLLAIINDILDYSKVEAGKLELEPIEFNIGSLMDSFGTEISVKASEKDVEIICKPSLFQLVGNCTHACMPAFLVGIVQVYFNSPIVFGTIYGPWVYKE